MQPESLNTIREKFLNFFESKGHLRLPSFSLIPRNDPSILLINAGMTPLKPYFTGAEKPPALRVTTCQKCIRTPDIDRVGQTARHGTYFEMLGNFSFGDYFKQEVIPWAWSFCTDVLEMPADRLYVSVFQDDDEAFDIWNHTVGLSKDRIYRMGKEDNFWEHGIGPCGPCSEIYFDRGPKYGCGKEDCHVGCDCDRFVEFWNLVFTQFYRDADGSYSPLEKKNIDTGAGLERLACIMQDVDNLFEVDTIRAILNHACELAQVTYGAEQRSDMAIRVITDHIRSTTMMISDGVIPSNEDRGYVLRRLLRRAARYGRLLGLSKPFLFKLVPTVISESSGAYPELESNRSRIIQIIRQEEERFMETIQQGSAILDQLIETARSQGHEELSGAEVFRLHDTFGFPFDLTREIAAEQGLKVDEPGFQAEMTRQKETARQAFLAKTGSAWDQGSLPEAVKRAEPTFFSGYETLEDEGTVRYLLITDEAKGLISVQNASEGDKVTVILDRTPFYAASGGQIGDTGQIISDNLVLSVVDTTRTAEGHYLHSGEVVSGIIRTDTRVQLQVDRQKRLATARNHTVTHLLHRALRDVLGDHIAQAGSDVAPDRFRFDFSHFQPMTDSEKQKVEDLVNQMIIQNEPVITRIMSLDDARAEGAVALFDEKYGSSVRVVSVGSFSKELCGGTHLRYSSEACQFRLISESGIASGVRRIEGVTGSGAWLIARRQGQELQALSDLVKTKPADLQGRIQHMIDQVHVLEHELSLQQKEKRSGLADDLVKQTVDMNGIAVLVSRVDVPDVEQLRALSDQIRDRLSEAVLVLAAEVSGKAVWVVTASKEAVQRGVHAGELIRELARITGGGGGGKPEMAQAGGKNPEKIEDALTTAQQRLQAILGS